MTHNIWLIHWEILKDLAVADEDEKLTWNDYNLMYTNKNIFI